MRKIFLVFTAFLTVTVAMQAKVVLPPIFADDMVLQQQSNAAVWGTATPDAEVVITATWSDVQTTVKADASGKWSAFLPTPVAGGPYEITFNDGEALTVKNVLIGEVWMCMGQSNMEMPLKGFEAQPVDNAADIILGAKASVPIRVCKIKKTVAYEVKDEAPAKWMENVPAEIGNASATAYFFALRLYETLDIPVGVIDVSYGGSYIEAWMPEELLRSEFDGEFDYAHLQTKTRTRAKAHHDPCVLYNGMLKPVMGYTSKGFIWYQGCSNSDKPEQYRRLQPAFVNLLRKSWNNESMPFYYTQIAPYKTNPPEMMWAQALNVYDIPNSAMATTHDAGDYTCIHPANKKTVGDRLAYLALVRDYGFDHFVDPYTPMPVKYEFKEGEAIVTFEVGKMGLSPRSKDLDGFEMAGEDGVWYPAKAVVLRGGEHKAKAIKVYKCPQVTKPVAVRYAWSKWCPSTLYNCFGIPATPFNSTIK